MKIDKDEVLNKYALAVMETCKKLNFKCFVGALRWHKFFTLYRSRTSRYEEPYPDDIYFYFAIQNNSVNWFINETSFQDCDYPEISYPEAVRLIEAIPEYPKENKPHVVLAALAAAERGE